MNVDKKLYVCKYHSGQYEDRREDILRAFDTESSAEDFVVFCNEKLDKMRDHEGSKVQIDNHILKIEYPCYVEYEEIDLYEGVYQFTG